MLESNPIRIRLVLSNLIWRIGQRQFLKQHTSDLSLTTALRTGKPYCCFLLTKAFDYKSSKEWLRLQ